ncbi:DegQ family serine endoprotease [Roseibium sp. CAU 1637]|uniref:DegQ family serine endoprotease n=1 Tax=Roseibium limicola TaxID=2816037 RepID=A0A939EMC5_9HYPH|nr:DegQ family serine endoprotease [Roseibium limicola]MBO0344805.1 DegQ family serine endoprotease [Roseibium limicola]
MEVTRRVEPLWRRKGAVFALIAGCVFGALGSAGGLTEAKAQEPRQIPSSAAEVQLSFAPVVKSVSPAVVNVYANRKVVRQRRVSPLFNDPFFKRFFGELGQGMGQPQERVESSLGSGVIISEDGTVITNYHVIENADEVRVALADRREFDAEIVLKDERTDLAVLKIVNDGPFESVPFAPADSLEVGDIVLALGNPFGVGQTVTQGIVSALARTQVGVTDYQFFIQTDAAINPGNSGGALVDMQGRLVGINSAIYSRSGGSNGIGFAIPAQMAQFVASAAGHGDRVKRPWLGASVQLVNAEIAEALSLDRPKGVLVTKVYPGSPADRSGLEVSDLVVAVDGKEVTDPNSFGYRFATRPMGGTTDFTIVRGSKERHLEISMEAAPETTARDMRVIKGYSPFAGTTVMNLSPAVSEELRLTETFEGVVISKVERGSTAARVGLKVGDIIRAVNEVGVESTRDLENISNRSQRLWALDIERGGKINRIVLRG